MSQATQTLPTAPVVLRGIRNTLILTGVTTAAADWLLYGHYLGVSFALLICIIAVCVAIAHAKGLSRKIGLSSAGLLVASVLPLVETFNLLSFCIALAGLCLYTLMISGTLSGNFQQFSKNATELIMVGPFRFIVDLTRSSAFLRRHGRPLLRSTNPASLVIPIALGAVFVLLFRAANPIIEQWMSEIDVGASIQAIDGARVLFWVFGIALAWPFMRVRLKSRPRKSEWSSEAATEALQLTSGEGLRPGFDVNEVLWSLVVFNALFAVQTALDLVYLWGGAELPTGLTYSEYAHRGTYALMATVLIAASFVLLALKPGGALEGSPWIRRLAYLWLSQNVVLVISSMLRLNLYIEAYSLTYMRVAAMIWMLLVAAGLVFVAGRMVLRRSNGWLVKSNVLVLAATLYICAFVNFPNLIASYNFAHDRYDSLGRSTLDVSYLCQLGRYAIPAIRKGLATHSEPWRYSFQLGGCMDARIARHQDRMANWRAWTFRGWRLTRFLDKSVVE